MTTIYTFRAFDCDGAIIAQSRGRAGALAKVLTALHDYRNAVERASGYRYGRPQSLGWYSIDGITDAAGFAGHVDPRSAIERMDRVGVARAAA